MPDETPADRARIAEAARLALTAAAIEAYEAAGFSGLCAEGRWEAAIGAMRSLDLRPAVSGKAPPR